ncbi:MAG: hypothetical protein WCD86_24995 [Ktedonobacteraceae bacterium]
MMNTDLNPQVQSNEELVALSDTETEAQEMGLLTEEGFTSEEIMSLIWLRQWYQSGGSDRAEVVRRLEFLKLLVLTGKLEA